MAYLIAKQFLAQTLAEAQRGPATVNADDPAEIIARGRYAISQFGPLTENCAFLMDSSACTTKNKSTGSIRATRTISKAQMTNIETYCKPVV